MKIEDMFTSEVGTVYHTRTHSIKVIPSFGECDRALYFMDKFTGESYVLENEILVNEDIKLEDLIQIQSLKLTDQTLYRFIHPSLGESLSFSTVRNILNRLNKEKSVSEVLSILKSMQVYGGNYANS